MQKVAETSTTFCLYYFDMFSSLNNIHFSEVDHCLLLRYFSMLNLCTAVMNCIDNS